MPKTELLACSLSKLRVWVSGCAGICVTCSTPARPLAPRTRPRGHSDLRHRPTHRDRRPAARERPSAARADAKRPSVSLDTTRRRKTTRRATPRRPTRGHPTTRRATPRHPTMRRARDAAPLPVRLRCPRPRAAAAAQPRCRHRDGAGIFNEDINRTVCPTHVFGWGIYCA